MQLLERLQLREIPRDGVGGAHRRLEIRSPAAHVAKSVRADTGDTPRLGRRRDADCGRGPAAFLLGLHAQLGKGHVHRP